MKFFMHAILCLFANIKKNKDFPNSCYIKTLNSLHREANLKNKIIILA